MKEKVSAPYFLRSRVPLGNASNLIGLHRAAEPKVVADFPVDPRTLPFCCLVKHLFLH